MHFASELPCSGTPSAALVRHCEVLHWTCTQVRALEVRGVLHCRVLAKCVESALAEGHFEFGVHLVGALDREVPPRVHCGALMHSV